MSTPTLRPLAAVVSLSVSTWAPAPAAQITWGEAFEVLQASDISNPPGASVVAALDFNNAAGWATGDDHVINGILFEQSASPMGVGEVSSLMASGSNYNATWYPNPTDDVDLDALLDSHAWHAGNPQETSITISGLTVGLNYQVQLIAVADSRGCCSARTYEPDDGTGNYGTGVTLQRGLFQSVLGTFTANADTQTILWRSLDSAAGNNDPGFSGLVVLEIDSEDTDGDGLFDTWEERYGLDPELSDTDGDMVPDDEEDGDNDGLDNGGEQSAGTDPTDPDTDGDGYEDGDENNTGTWTNDQATGTDPTNPDSDGDTLVDGVENPEQPFVDENQTGSDPNLVDTDADQLPDNVEVAIELDPNDPDTDGNGTPDGGEDEDMDGSPNAMELANGTGISDPDSDGDSLLDGVETNTGTFADATNTGTDPLLVDSDGDTIADGDEVEGSNGYRTNPNLADTDGDLVADGVEVEEGTDPTDPNSTPAIPTISLIGGLLGGDLTDPEDDGLEGPTVLGPPQTAGTGFDWFSISASSEEYFHNQGLPAVGEGAFDIFDNTVGSGGAKWCCGGAPQSATVEFEEPVSLTHFTITSGNDVPLRDPLDWGIYGSDDGVTYEPIFVRMDDAPIWTARNQTARIDLPGASPAYRFIRYEVTRTGNANHQINEIEYFGTVGQLVPLEITDFSYNPVTGEASVTWNSRPNRDYSLFLSFDAVDWGSDIEDSIESQGESTTFEFTNPELGQGTVVFRVQENG